MTLAAQVLLHNYKITPQNTINWKNYKQFGTKLNEHKISWLNKWNWLRNFSLNSKEKVSLELSYSNLLCGDWEDH